MQKQQYLPITQKAKYATLGELSKTTTQVWFVLHGYGQLAQYFIRKFNILDDHRCFVVAPEALAKFYLEENSGRVGATWMTKEDRLVDIENYITYLNTLYTSLQLPENAEINVVGFSQGAATASRWLANGQITATNLLLWSGIFPPDLDIIKAQNALSRTEVFNIYGSDDPYLTPHISQQQKEIVKQLHINVKEINFEGGHDIDQETLKKFIKN